LSWVKATWTRRKIRRFEDAVSKKFAGALYVAWEFEWKAGGHIGGRP